MPKALCIVGMVIAALLALLFGVDLFLKFRGAPLIRGTSMVLNAGFILCAAALAYLAWSTFREQV
jgi:TRAP-type C4-dicarboxylate transport system permease small subunit